MCESQGENEIHMTDRRDQNRCTLQFGPRKHLRSTGGDLPRRSNVSLNWLPTFIVGGAPTHLNPFAHTPYRAAKTCCLL